MNDLTQMFYLLYSLITMLAIAVLSIQAYRKSLKKVFIVLMIVAIPISINKIYRTYRYITLRYGPTPTYQSLQKNPPPVRVVRRQMEREKSAVWDKATAEMKQIEKKYSKELYAENPKRFMRGWWQRFEGILRTYLLPIGIVMVCINEMKNSNHRLHSIAGSARSE